MEQTGDSFIDAAAAGDKEAQRSLFMGHYRPIHAFIVAVRAKDRSRHDADEIANDTFSRAFRDLSGFRKDCSFRSWLLSLSKNAAIDYYRLKANRQPAPVTSLEPNEVSTGSDPEDSTTKDPLAKILSNESHTRILTLLAQLSEDHRSVIMLRQVEELCVRETAAIMGLTEPATRMLHMRALERLSVLMKTDPYFSRKAIETE